MPSDSRTIARAIHRFYAIGIRPDWWKLEPQRDPAAWRHIEAAVREGDPECRGILLLGLSSPMDELIESFPAAARSPLVKGFAVGRTIFYRSEEHTSELQSLMRISYAVFCLK